MNAIIEGEQELATFVAQLVREGVLFEIQPIEGRPSAYAINFSGGF